MSLETIKNRIYFENKKDAKDVYKMIAPNESIDIDNFMGIPNEILTPEYTSNSWTNTQLMALMLLADDPSLKNVKDAILKNCFWAKEDNPIASLEEGISRAPFDKDIWRHRFRWI